jgi:hypothetical protein
LIGKKPHTENSQNNLSQPQTEESNSIKTNDQDMVNCGKSDDPQCFISRMNSCLPVTAEMTGSDNKTKIELTILGIENDTCHFQRKINGNMDLNCYFPKGTMNLDTIDQTFGNDKGLQKVVDSACKKGWS